MPLPQPTGIDCAVAVVGTGHNGRDHGRGRALESSDPVQGVARDL
jgi:hypothetical protein